MAEGGRVEQDADGADEAGGGGEVGDWAVMGWGERVCAVNVLWTEGIDEGVVGMDGRD